MVQDIANEAKEALAQAVESKTAYETQYAVFRKLLFASSREIPLNDIVDCIDMVVIGSNRKIAVKWISL